MDAITFANPEKIKELVVLDMGEVYQTEARVHEIAGLTHDKAPELIAAFSRSSFILGRHLRKLHEYAHKADRKASHRRAILLVDVLPAKMAEVKMAQNESNRQALLDLDEELELYVNLEAEIGACLVYVKQKISDMESAISSIRRIMRDTEGETYRPNHNLSTGSINKSPEITEVGQKKLKVGKANYGT
jgi:hypothetical protein